MNIFLSGKHEKRLVDQKIGICDTRPYSQILVFFEDPSNLQMENMALPTFTTCPAMPIIFF